MNSLTIYTQVCPPPERSQDGRDPTPEQVEHTIPAGIKPTNFIEVSTLANIRGVWVIDPVLVPPSPLTAPSRYQGGWDFDRKNALMESQEGNIDAHLFVLTTPTHTQRKLLLHFESWEGSARVRVHEAPPRRSSHRRQPIKLYVKATQKTAGVYIPRSFKGPLDLLTGRRGKVRYSKAVKAQVTEISSVNGHNKCFVGDFKAREWKNGGVSWSGDELQVDAKEVISIYYVDEGSIPTKDTNIEACIIA